MLNCKLIALLAASIVFIPGCASSGAAYNPSAKAYELVLKNLGNRIEIRLVNTSNEQVKSGGLFLVFGRGSAGLYLSVSDKNDRVHRMCTIVNQGSSGAGLIPPHDYLKREISLSALKDFYCLSPGTYKVRATFAVPQKAAAPEIVADSAPITVTIGRQM